MTEIWKAVPGFEGRYEVSNLGRIRSTGWVRIDRLGRVYTTKRKVLAGGMAAGRYPMCRLSHSDGTVKPVYVHDAVAAAFLGPKPPGALTRHRNDDPTDNRVENIQYGSQADNMTDAVVNGRIKFSEQHHNCKYSASLIVEVRASSRRMTSTQAEDVFGVSARYIRELWAGERRTRG